MNAHEPSGRRTGRGFMLVFALLGGGHCHGRLPLLSELRAALPRRAPACGRRGTEVGEVLQYRKERLGDANILNHNPAFSKLVRRFLEQPEDADAQRRLQTWIGKIRTSHQYDRVFLLDARGIEWLAIPYSSGPAPVHLADDAVKVLHSGQVTFLDFHRDAPDDPIHLGVVVPILDESDAGHPLDVLDLRPLRVPSGECAFHFICSSGNRMARPPDLRVRHPSADVAVPIASCSSSLSITIINFLNQAHVALIYSD